MSIRSFVSKYDAFLFSGCVTLMSICVGALILCGAVVVYQYGMTGIVYVLRKEFKIDFSTKEI